MTEKVHQPGKTDGPDKVEAIHPEVFHYTNAAGLIGILQTQQIRATHIEFMNDADEHIGFFRHRLPILLRPTISEAIDTIYKAQKRKAKIDAEGGKEIAVDNLLRQIVRALSNSMMAFSQPYIAAFCSVNSHQNPDDGLLSQWRGYGGDGGYAIVFTSKIMNELLDAECKAFSYQFFKWGDVDYDDSRSPHSERAGWEDAVCEGIRRDIVDGSSKAAGELYEQIAALACRYKHSGFREESEVRIIAIPSNDDVYQAAIDRGDALPRKPMQFTTKNGLVVPHIMLFNNKVGDQAAKLPISKIIIGPHPDSGRRRKAVEALLRKCEITAIVRESRIPYLGL